MASLQMAIAMNRQTQPSESGTAFREKSYTLRRLTLALLMLIVVAASVASAMPPVPYFSQCDPRWGSD